MLQLFVRARLLVDRIRNEQAGLTAIEYGVFAAFVVLMLVGAAILVGPQLRTWLVSTIDCIIRGQASCNTSA